jgi:hypothetical protein
MKKIALLVIGLAIAGISLSAAAREGDVERLAACEAGLQALYGAETGVKLRSLSHKSGGAYLRLKVKPAGGDSQRVTCLVGKTGDISLMDSNGVALATGDYDAADQVSLVGQ